LLFAYCAHKANAFAQNSADQPLIFAVVADCSAGRIDAARQGRFRNDPPIPNSRQHVVPAHHAIAVSNQELQQVEDLGFDGAQLAVATQLAPVDVDGTIVE
jgi:hypothetical protein